MSDPSYILCRYLDVCIDDASGKMGCMMYDSCMFHSQIIFLNNRERNIHAIDQNGANKKQLCIFLVK